MDADKSIDEQLHGSTRMLLLGTVLATAGEVCIESTIKPACYPVKE